jgi:hypothetical protein
MTPDRFIAKWKATDLSERAAAQSERPDTFVTCLHA